MTLRYGGAFRAGLVFVAATTAVLLTAFLINVSFGLPFKSLQASGRRARTTSSKRA